MVVDDPNMNISLMEDCVFVVFIHWNKNMFL